MERLWLGDRYEGARRIIAIGIGMIALAACGGSANSSVASAARTSATAAGTTPERPTLRFDYLGGGSRVIQVYPGPTDSGVDRISDGTFEDGQTADIECETTGRNVHSHPELGEQDKQSDEWYRIHAGGRDYYATAVYADISGGTIPAC